MYVLTDQNVDPDQLSDPSDTHVYGPGHTMYYRGYARIAAAGRREARVAVFDRGAILHNVEVRLDEGVVKYACNCPIGEQDAACSHKVAAAFALRDYLRYYPVATWETLLDRVVKEAPKRPRTGELKLLFSLQKRGTTWGVHPYTVPASALPDPGDLDVKTMTRLMESNHLSREAKPIRSKTTLQRLDASSSDARLAAQLAALSIGTYSYYVDQNSYLCPVLEALTGRVLFVGTEAAPLKQAVQVLEAPARVRVELKRVKGELQLTTELEADGQIVPRRTEEIEMLSEAPLWMMAKGMIFRVDESDRGGRFLLSQPDIEIPAGEEDLFLESYLPRLAALVPIEGDLIEWRDLDVEPAPRIYLTEEDGELIVRLRFAYGDLEAVFDKSTPTVSVIRAPDETALVRVRRRGDAEAARVAELASFKLKRTKDPERYELRARTDPVDFLLHQVPRMAAAGYEVFGEQQIAMARVNRNRPTLSLNVSSGIDWFDVEAVVRFGDLAVPLPEIRKAVRKRERYIKLADGSIGEIPEEWIARYRHLFAFGEETDEGIRLQRHHLVLLDQLIEDADGAQTDEEFEQRRRRLRDFKAIVPRDLPAGLHAELRPYQKAGYDWLHFLHEYEFGGCLADDMGIGKTVQALATLLSHRETGHATRPDLVVVPRSLVFNWEREAARFTPGLRILTYSDASRPSDLAEFDRYDMVLTTYGIMLRDIEQLKEYRFHYVLLDESQAIKNPVALTSRAARLLQADHKLVLTGTPVENSTLELWSQFAFLNPGLLGNLEFFKEEFGAAIERRQDEPTADLLRRMVHPFILRRTKDQVAPELPPRQERVVYSEMEPDQRKLYERTRDHYRALLLGLIETEGMNNARMKVLEGLLRLRQICNHPRLVDPASRAGSAKYEELMETLETLRAEGHKALVFSQFVKMLDIVKHGLEEREIPYAYLTGSTRDRQGRVDAFQADPEIPFFLISLKAGGVGLNLTAADYVIHIDPWWNPAVEMQATDRTHRIGQVKPVFVHKLIAKDSVEEKIMVLQDRKRKLVEQLIATESGFFKSLGPDDVRVLFE